MHPNSRFNRVPSHFIAATALTASVLVLGACSQKPHSESRSETRTSETSSTRTTAQVKATNTTPRDTVLRDTTRVLGTPGSPTGAESRGMPGEKPIPGTKK